MLFKQQLMFLLRTLSDLDMFRENMHNLCFMQGPGQTIFFLVFSRRQERRFLVIDPMQLILVEPDSKRLGWGVVRFVGFLQVGNIYICALVS